MCYIIVEDDGPGPTSKPQLDYSAGKIWLCIAIICTLFFSIRLISQNYDLKCGKSKYCIAEVQSVDNNGNAIYSVDGMKMERYIGECTVDDAEDISVIIKDGEIKDILTIANCWPIPISWIFMVISFISCKEEYMDAIKEWECKEKKKKGR